MKIWESKPPGTLWATPGLLRDDLTFTFYFVQIVYYTNVAKHVLNYTKPNSRH